MNWQKTAIRELMQQLKDEIDRMLIEKPFDTCCGKAVVFLPGRKHYICSRCRTKWEFVAKAFKVKRDDWEQMAKEAMMLIKRLQKKPREKRLGYQFSPEGILNAYREGDISFKKAAAQLRKWKRSG